MEGALALPDPCHLDSTGAGSYRSGRIRAGADTPASIAHPLDDPLTTTAPRRDPTADDRPSTSPRSWGSTEAHGWTHASDPERLEGHRGLLLLGRRARGGAGGRLRAGHVRRGLRGLHRRHPRGPDASVRGSAARSPRRSSTTIPSTASTTRCSWPSAAPRASTASSAWCRSPRTGSPRSSAPGGERAGRSRPDRPGRALRADGGDVDRGPGRRALGHGLPQRRLLRAPRGERDVDDLRLAFCVLTTRWTGSRPEAAPDRPAGSTAPSGGASAGTEAAGGSRGGPPRGRRPASSARGSRGLRRPGAARLGDRLRERLQRRPTAPAADGPRQGRGVHAPLCPARPARLEDLRAGPGGRRGPDDGRLTAPRRGRTSAPTTGASRCAPAACWARPSRSRWSPGRAPAIPS